jgi:hypothetical protein
MTLPNSPIRRDMLADSQRTTVLAGDQTPSRPVEPKNIGSPPTLIG